MLPLPRSLFCAAAFATAFAVSARADWVLDWNVTALDATRTSGETSAEASRNLAILHTAIYDAITTLDGGFTSYLASTPAPLGADQRAAVAAAANTVLGALYPALGSSFTTIYNDELATITNSQAKTDGVNWGNQIATQILNARQVDGASNAATTPYTPSGQMGDWAATPHVTPSLNYKNPPFLPGWGSVQPFVMTSGNQFRPGASPDLSSVAYANALNQVAQYGARSGSLRNADQTAQAYFWTDQPGQNTQVAHWNQIAGHLLGGPNGADLRTEARVMAAMNVAMADAGIAAWDAKYFYDVWVPITAIAYASPLNFGDPDPDNNPLTDRVDFWEPLIDSLPMPEYVSEVSAFSSAAAEILKHYFGDVAFSYQGDSDGNGTYDMLRNFASITAAADEAGMAGIYSGEHFSFADAAGQAVGTSVASMTVANYFLPISPVPEPSSLLFVALSGVLALRRRRA